MIQLSGINFWKLAVLFFNCVLLKELRVLVLNKTDLEWCTGTENDKKLRKNMGGSRGRGAGVDGQPPSFRTAHQKKYTKI